MKKTFIALLLTGSSLAMWAQDVQNPDDNISTTTTTISTSGYHAYGTAPNVPPTVQYSFQKDYPYVTEAQWYQTPAGQWRVRYKNNTDDMDVYYFGTSAQSYMVALPVLQSQTPEDIISKVKGMYSMNLYDVNRIKAANGQYVYHVRLLENGQVRDEWVSEDGTAVLATDVYRTAEVATNDVIEEVNTTTTSDSNAAMSTETSTPVETKTKVKYSDGTKIKTKTK